MIERLRALSPPSRYLIYVASVLVVLVVAVGVGAAAAVVVGWQSRRVATGPAETGTLEGSKPQKTRPSSRPAIARTPTLRSTRHLSSIALRMRTAAETTPISATRA
jgi:hypothetical protein